MNAPLPIPAQRLQAEWERLQFLAFCLAKSREGQVLAPEDIEKLQTLQRAVEVLRYQQAVWGEVLPAPLDPLEIDALVCIVAPEIEPRLGWLYQNLQLASAQPWATRALIQELLALNHEQAVGLQQALSQQGNLVTNRLIQESSADPYHPLRPQQWFSERLRGHHSEAPAPPDSVRVDDEAGWDQLVLPPDRIAMLKEFLLWIEHRETVVERWGGARLGGPVALFSGPSGTGKTLAASVLANSLGWALYRVDLGRLVSKYIGETEKNLNRLFDAVHGCRVVLQFDEADTLFARRGEVKEARDRYANMEVSHLLSRIEQHQGPCILTTNLRKQIDSAFSRRFQMVVEFPCPDAPARARLWRILLPPRAPLSDRIDPQALGQMVTLTGGGIRNAALHAAYLAARDGSSIDLPHIAVGVWREIGKANPEADLADLGPLAQYLPKELIHVTH